MRKHLRQLNHHMRQLIVLTDAHEHELVIRKGKEQAFRHKLTHIIAKEIPRLIEETGSEEFNELRKHLLGLRAQLKKPDAHHHLNRAISEMTRLNNRYSRDYTWVYVLLFVAAGSAFYYFIGKNLGSNQWIIIALLAAVIFWMIRRRMNRRYT
ncbi:hypothetical protein ACFL0V_02425 [Nanoarchaeota archaeon]